MKEPPAGIEIVNVTHASPVAAVSTSSGPRRFLASGFGDALGTPGRPVTIRDADAPDGVQGAVRRSFAVADAVARLVRNAFDRGRFAIILSGSCHTALGSIAGLPGDRPRGVVWIDRHADFNTPETTRSGLLDGTTLACATGRGWARLRESVTGFSPVADSEVLLLDARDVDPDEAHLLCGSGVEVLTGNEMRRRSHERIRSLGDRVESAYLHIDMDVLDPAVAKANAFATDGGLSAEELLSLLETVLREMPLKAVGLASYDPRVDPGGRVVEVALSIGRKIARNLGAR